MAKLADFTPDKGNANKGTQRGLKALDTSVRKYGMGRSILADRKGRIIAGNKTAERAADIGIEDVIVVESDGTKLVVVKRTDLDLEDDGGKARALATYDNRSGQLDLDWDIDALSTVDADVLKELWTVDELDEWGIIEKPQGDAEPQIDRAAELQEKWQVKTGDLWRIGDHRLLCGDSTKREDVEKAMGGESAELLFTSPPYSDMRAYNGGDLSIENLIKFIPAFYGLCNYQVINLGIQRREGEIYSYWDSYINKAKECGYSFLAWNIWNRVSAKTIAQQSAMFPISHEWIFIFGNEAKELNKTKRKADATLKDKRIDNTNKYTSITSVLTLQPSLDENVDKHPARFPVEFPSEYIGAMSHVGDCITDPFVGSGTTIVACQNLGRKCRAIEISPEYCAVTLERMATAFPGIEIERQLTVEKQS